MGTLGLCTLSNNRYDRMREHKITIPLKLSAMVHHDRTLMSYETTLADLYATG